MEDINIQFVEEVEKYPELYDYTKPNYARKYVVEKVWVEVGRKFNLTGNESKEKWWNLRNAFIKNLKPAASGASAKQTKNYYLSEAMQFTFPFVRVSGTTSGSLPKVPGYTPTEPDPSLEGSFVEQDEAPDQPDMEYMQQTLPTSASPPPPQPPTCPSTSLSASPAPIHEERSQQGHLSAKRKRAVAGMDVTSKSISEYFLAKKKYVEAKQQLQPGQSETLKMILLSLIPDLEALTPAQIRTFKRRTLMLIEDLTDGASPDYVSPYLITSASQSPVVVGLAQSPWSVEVEPSSEVREQSLKMKKNSLSRKKIF